ncbi:hypothetical protein GGS26DRAFT_404609 [Hypomontagnella submonticulosa]|nr:hypothetical protein GGS26DRAFT_404609 [Hypomontagnella submonticulosa]
MSVFSIIRRSRAQAKEHNARKAEKAKEETVKLPYKHVVTHAAIDALSGAPSSWKQADRTKIMEQNQRRTAMTAGETSMAGMPRVGSSLSYVSYASVYATPVVPLPRNYSYSNIPTSWRKQLANSHQEGSEYCSHSGSTGNGKGKEKEFIQPSSSIGPSPIIFPAVSSVISSKGASLSGSSTNLSASDDELEMKKAANHRPRSIGYQQSLSQQDPQHSSQQSSHQSFHQSPFQSFSSSEKSYQTPLPGSRSTVETPTKSKRHYPPPAQSTYFSAPRPLNRRILNADTSVPSVPAATERTNPATPTYNMSPTATSIGPIGIAIAPPYEPCYKAPQSPLSIEDNAYSDEEQNNTASPIVPSAQIPRVSPTEPYRVQSSVIPEKANGNGHAAQPSNPPTQRRRRRLSKTRPPSMDSSGVRNSIDTMRPSRPSTASTVTPTDFTPINYSRHRKTGEAVIVSSFESIQKSSKKLTKNPESRQGQKGRWNFRLGGSKTAPAVDSH